MVGGKAVLDGRKEKAENDVNIVCTYDFLKKCNISQKKNGN